MELIGENKMMSHTKPVWLHWMIRPKVNATHIPCNNNSSYATKIIPKYSQTNSAKMHKIEGRIMTI